MAEKVARRYPPTDPSCGVELPYPKGPLMHAQHLGHKGCRSNFGKTPLTAMLAPAEKHMLQLCGRDWTHHVTAQQCSRQHVTRIWLRVWMSLFLPALIKGSDGKPGFGDRISQGRIDAKRSVSAGNESQVLGGAWCDCAPDIASESPVNDTPSQQAADGFTTSRISNMSWKVMSMRLRR